MKYKKALIIGRFQPFHLGHLYLLKKTLEIAEKVIIGIGSESIFDENNPLSFNERKKMIEQVFEDEKIKDKLEKIVGLEDFFNDDLWRGNVIKLAGDFDIVVSNNEWTNKIMEQADYKVVRFPYYRREKYEGWRIRKLIKLGKKWKNRVPKNTTSLISKKKSKIFKYVVLGGSFDHLHKGHQLFLKTAFSLGQFVLIGLTTDDFIKNKFLSLALEDYQTRKKNLEEFLKKNNWQNFKIIPISDFTGGADKNKQAEAIIVSKNTYYNALKINDLRVKNGLKKLRIIIVGDVLTESGDIISSEKIRTGEIDRKGKSYYLLIENIFQKQKQKLVLPEKFKNTLRKPLGKIFKNTQEVLDFLKKNQFVKLITVGDFISYEFLKNNIIPDLMIFDYLNQKKSVNEKIKEFLKKDDFTIEIENKKGKLTKNTFITIKNTIKKILTKNEKWRVFVKGEEDLLTLPTVLFSPLKSIIFYGHFQYGVIGVEVDEKIKKKILIILKKFH